MTPTPRDLRLVKATARCRRCRAEFPRSERPRSAYCSRRCRERTWRERQVVEAVAESRGHEAGCWAMFDFTGTVSHFLVARWAVDPDPLAPHDGLAICGRSGVVKLKSLERHPHEAEGRRYCGNCVHMLQDHVARVGSGTP